MAIQLNKKLFRPDIKPSHILIEQTALEFAAVYYEAGRSTGLTSKFKDARAFAKANWPKFIPRVVDHFLDMLNNPKYNKHVKDTIFEALMERHNDPTLNAVNPALPDIDVKKVLALQEHKVVIESKIDQLMKGKDNGKKRQTSGK